MRWFMIALAIVGLTFGSGALGLGWMIISAVALLFLVGVWGERQIDDQRREISLLQAKLRQRDHALQALLDGASTRERLLLSDQLWALEREAERRGDSSAASPSDAKK